MSAKTELEKALAVLRRRKILREALKPEVLDAIADALGTTDMIYAFPLNNPDPLVAMRRDTLLGSVRVLRYESSDEAIKAATQNVEDVHEMMQYITPLPGKEEENA